MESPRIRRAGSYGFISDEDAGTYEGFLVRVQLNALNGRCCKQRAGEGRTAQIGRRYLRISLQLECKARGPNPRTALNKYWILKLGVWNPGTGAFRQPHTVFPRMHTITCDHPHWIEYSIGWDADSNDDRRATGPQEYLWPVF